MLGTVATRPVLSTCPLMKLVPAQGCDCLRFAELICLELHARFVIEDSMCSFCVWSFVRLLGVLLVDMYVCIYIYVI